MVKAGVTHVDPGFLNGNIDCYQAPQQIWNPIRKDLPLQKLAERGEKHALYVVILILGSYANPLDNGCFPAPIFAGPGRIIGIRSLVV
jgi:hypothetical protein